LSAGKGAEEVNGCGDVEGAGFSGLIRMQYRGNKTTLK
jgi:hypothetical protein